MTASGDPSAAVPVFAPTALEQRSPWDTHTEPWRPLHELLRQAAAGPPPAEPSPPSPVEVAFAEGFAKGRAEAAAAAGPPPDYAAAIAALVQQRQAVLAQSEAQLAQLALHVAHQLVLTDTQARALFAAQMAQHALQLLHEADKITLRVAPDEWSTLVEKFPALQDLHGVEIMSDPQLAAGGVVAECALGRVDGSLARRLGDYARLLKVDEADL